MEIKDIRNEKLATSLIENLKRRHYEAYYCHDTEEMKRLVVQLIPEGSSITWGGSATIRDTGLTTLLKKGNYQVYDRDEATTPEEKNAIYVRAFTCDYYLASANAISEDGVIVNIDGNGNRVAAMTFGPKSVIVIAGINKVMPDLDSAVARARHIAAPVNAQRFNLRTPCLKTGLCADCQSPDRICNVFQVIARSKPAGRIKLILVGEDLGF